MKYFIDEKEVDQSTFFKQLVDAATEISEMYNSSATKTFIVDAFIDCITDKIFYLNNIKFMIK